MFGYIVVNQQELKLREFERYRSYYCGICRILKKRYGKLGQLTLSYDMTFMAILLNGLYEPKQRIEKHICVTHPGKKHPMLMNKIGAYAADMGILLSYYNLMDDWKDDRNLHSVLLASLLKPACRKLKKLYPRQYAAVEGYVRRLSDCERRKDREPSVDEAAGLTGEMLGEIFVYSEDVWADELRRVGFFLGKFIYLMDAYEDLDEDKEKNSYNPWKGYSRSKEFDTIAERILNMMMTDCALAFEKLPILQDVEILRNILYSGVWTKFEARRKRRSRQQDDVS